MYVILGYCGPLEKEESSKLHTTALRPAARQKQPCRKEA